MKVSENKANQIYFMNKAREKEIKKEKHVE